MRRVAIVLFWLLALSLHSQQDDPLVKARESIRADDLKKHVETLSSDEFQGRNANTPGCEKAKAYVVDQFKSFGLKPAMEGYVQKFTFPVRNDSGPRMLTPKMGEAANVVGLVEGSDEKLKSEVIVIGAHYDHVGMTGQPNPGRLQKKDAKGDQIWHGADDNASGTSALLSVAKAFTSSGLKPKRSILFIAFSAEEQGLYGSLWYIAHPLVPLEKTAFMINLDMVGRQAADKPVEVHGVASGAGVRESVERIVKEQELQTQMFSFGDVREPDSDHSPFYDAKIPTLFFFTGLHEDYHEPTDKADKLNYPSMEKIARCVLALAVDLADRAQRPAFVPPPELGIVQSGFLVEEDAQQMGLDPGFGGIRVETVKKDSIADRAGLKYGDWILELGGTKLPLKDTLKMLRRAIEGVKPGESVPIVVSRDGKRLTLQAEWK